MRTVNRMAAGGDVNPPTSEFREHAVGRTGSGDLAAGPTDAGPADAVGPAGVTPPPEGDRVAASAAPAGPGRSSGPRALWWLAGVVVLVLALVSGVRAVGAWPDWRNPFAQRSTDRSQPALLQSIQDLSRYVAAEGNFQVVVDLQRDRRYVPEFLVNQRTLFVGAGTVEAYVDFGSIAEGAVVESTDRKSVEVRLPAPQLGRANLDLERSYVFAEERGLLNRLGEVFGGDPNRQQRVYQLAQERITAAARESGLIARAEENTRKMLVGLLRSLGYETVTVSYVSP